MIITPEIWMIINLGSLAFIIVLALLSYFKKDPTLKLMARVLILIIRMERRRISPDPEAKGTDQKASSMVSTPTEGHNPSQEEEEILRELEEKLEGLI